ncbi:MAG: orotidine-5'-phosphate decarboxylase [Candidatus Brocadiaceae bacterium]|jgi:orotidine-5'-phosphate decarboxylase
MAEEHFADRLLGAVRGRESQVVVGLDPRISRLPREVMGAAGEKPGRCEAAARAIVEFNRQVIDAVAEQAVAVKPQVAFYEQYGVAGMRAYAETIGCARARGLLVIGDVKRNDIASTAEAYAAAHLGGSDVPDCGDFLVDALTVNPYLGADGVRPFLEAASRTGRGVFALVKTSNPSSVDVQDLDCEGRPLYERVAGLVEEWGEPHRGEGGYSLLGAVVGAPFPKELARLRELMPHAPFLVPGFGAQGGGVEEVRAAFDSEGTGAVVNSSRGIIFAWQRPPYDERFGEARWREAIAAAAADMRRQLWDATH